MERTGTVERLMTVPDAIARYLRSTLPAHLADAEDDEQGLVAYYRSVNTEGFRPARHTARAFPSAAGQ